MLRTIAALCGTVMLAGTLVVAQTPAPAAKPAPDAWMARTTKTPFQTQKAPDASLQIDVPKKDWMALPTGGATVLMVASRKGDAVVAIERSTMRQALEAADITDLFAQIETDAIKERHPKATDFLAKVMDSGERRLVAVQFTRPGVLGLERVRQYSIPVGKQLYRITCVSAAAQFAAYDPLFSHMAASFAVTAG
ncbi:MAG TPA: hypothetical protein VGK32_18735 [Vicinamibacterales bacterium]